MTGSVNISQLPDGQGISPVSAAATIGLDGCNIGFVTPKAAVFTIATVNNPDNSPGIVIKSPVIGSLVIGQTGATSTTSASLTAIGYQALNANTTGNFNVAVGNLALTLNSTGSLNVAVGASALKISTGSNNSGFGTSAGILLTTGSNNTLLGQSAGGQITSGSQNTCVGVNSGGISTGTNNTTLGYNLSVPDATASNQLLIHNLIYGDSTSSAQYLRFVGGRIDTATRVVTAAGAVTVSIADYNIIVNKGTGAATIVNIPVATFVGQTYIIKDGKGDASSNNITITPNSANIDGASTLVISTNYGHAKIVWNGTQWNQM